MRAICFVFLGVLMGLGFQTVMLDSAQAKQEQKFAIETDPTLDTFTELKKACKSGKIKSEKAGELVNTFSTRLSEWDVPALLVMKQHCTNGNTGDLALEKLSQDALLKHPKNLIQALIEEKVSKDLLVKIADNNMASSKECKDECLKKETQAFELRMEKISGLELNTQEREMRDRFLSEMRVAFGKLKEKKLK